MKFAGLILICATSSLALILPAIGVVEFPAANPTPTPFGSTVPVAPPLTPQAAANSGNQLGMGIWLLLAPVCLFGLAMWTFAPNPSGSKSKFTKS